MPTEKRYSEFRSEGNTLAGVAITYNEVTKIGSTQERFEPGAFGEIPKDIILTEMHNREKPVSKVQLIDSTERLEVRANLNPDFDARVIHRVKTGLYTGFSVEFIPVKERIESQCRVVESARLCGLSLVDRPAYANSRVELRASSFNSKIPYATKLGCACCDGADYVELSSASFNLDELIEQVKQGKRDVLAVRNNYSKPVASLRRGSMQLTETANGINVVIPRLPDSQTARDMVEESATVDIVARPYFVETAESESFVEDDVKKIVNARLRSIDLVTSDIGETSGWMPGKFEPVTEGRGVPLLWL